jgi:hypothetical protein
MRLPIDWPRINQFPEWFTVEADRGYDVETCEPGSAEARHNSPAACVGPSRNVLGSELRAGLPVTVAAGADVKLRVVPRADAPAPRAAR